MATTPAPPTAGTAGRVVSELYTALAHRDAARATGLLADDVSWIVPDTLPAGGAYRGREAVGAYVARLLETWRQLTFEPERSIEDRGSVAVSGQSHVTCALTGRRDRIPFAHFVEVEDGKVVALDEHTDTMRIATLLQHDRRSSTHAVWNGF
jgi:ketosteroid isomerase-like protein